MSTRSGSLALAIGAAVVCALAYAGYVAVTVVLDARNRPAMDPVVICAGLPQEVVDTARRAAIDGQDRLNRFDDDPRAIEEIRRTVRREIQDVWGKKPVVKVEIARAG